MITILKKTSILFVVLLVSIGNTFAGDGPHKLVIQVSTDDPRTQVIALNNAVNLQKLYGMDNVQIEIVAYGPGLGLMTKKSKQAQRVTSLAMQDITFSACANTMAKVKKKTGKEPKLLEGVQYGEDASRGVELFDMTTDSAEQADQRAHQPIVADDLRSHAAAQEQFAKSNAASGGEAAQLTSADEDERPAATGRSDSTTPCIPRQMAKRRARWLAAALE